MVSTRLAIFSCWTLMTFFPLMACCQNGQPSLKAEAIFRDMVFYWDESGSKNWEEIEALYEANAFYKPDTLSYIHKRHNPLFESVYWAVYAFIPDSSLMESGQSGFCIFGDTIYLKQKFEFLDFFYRNVRGKLIHERTGKIVNTYKKAKDWRFSENCVPIDYEGQDTIRIFLRLLNMGTYPQKFYGYQTQIKKEKNRINQVIISDGELITFRLIFIGILLYFCLYAFIQYWQIKEPAYLYYSIYLLGTFIYTAEHLEWDSDVYGIFSNITEWHFHFEVPLVSLIYLSYLFFFISFLDLKKEHSRAVRYLTWGIYLVIVILLIDVIARQIGGVTLSMFFYKYDRYPLFIITLLAFYELYKIDKKRTEGPSYKEKKKLVRYLAVGSSCLVLGSLTTLTIKEQPFINHDSGQLFRHSLTYTQLGLLAENIIFIIGLGYKTRLNALLLQQEISSQSEKIELIEDRTTRLKVDAHTMKNILQAIQGLVTTKPHEAGRYLVQAAKLCEKWYNEALQEQDEKYHPLKDEIEDMETWVLLNNMLLDPKIQLQTAGKNELDDTFPQVIKRLLLPFIENAIIHGLKPQKEVTRVLKIEINRQELGYEIIIEDNGIGRIAANDLANEHFPLKESTGISISKELMASDGLTLRIEDLMQAEKPKGTRIVIKIPN